MPQQTTARKVADHIIGYSHETGDPISNLKLQKLLYYAQAWHLALYDEPMFADRIEAWVHGPAVPSVYGEFKGWAWKPIDYDPERTDLCEEHASHLAEVMQVYGGFTAPELESLTHAEDPWRDARAGLPPDVPSNATIKHDVMKRYYRTRLTDGQDQDRQA